MLSKQSLEALNEHMNQEFYASWLYLSMAAYFEETPYDGFAGWMRSQSSEEYAHGMKFYQFIADRDSRITLDAIDKPAADFGSPLELFETALAHERQVSEQIHTLYEEVRKDNDYPSEVFLQWFIQEQVEEEKTVSGIVDKLKILGDNGVGLFMLDRELAARSAGPQPAE